MRCRLQARAQQHGVAAAVSTPKPAGLELKVTFQGGVADTQAAYAALAQELGGMLCAGVGIAPRLAIMAAPRVGWRLTSHAPPSVAAATTAGAEGAAGGRQIYAWLPQEALCTENLEAWRRLLPCQQHAGLAALLQPRQLAAASYASLGLELWVEPVASANSRSSQMQSSMVRLRQVLTAVLPQQEPAAAGQQALLQAAFGGVPPAACAAASASRLYAALPGGANGGGAATAGGCSLEQMPAAPLLSCNAANAKSHPPADVLQAPAGLAAQARAEPALRVVQHLVQHGARDGMLVVGVRVAAAAASAAGSALQAGGGSTRDGSSSDGSGSSTSAPLLHLMQLLPWQLLVQPSSLRVELDGEVRSQSGMQLPHWGMANKAASFSCQALVLKCAVQPPPIAGSGVGPARPCMKPCLFW